MQIAPIYLPLKPDLKYGGIERVVYNLDKQFTKQGHESYVIASGDSKIRGRLLPTFEESLWRPQLDKEDGWKYKRDGNLELQFEEHCAIALEHIKKIKPDIVHTHIAFIKSKAFRDEQNPPPILYTFHSPVIKDYEERFRMCKESASSGRSVFFNAVSESQRRDFNELIRVDYCILNAIDVSSFPYQNKGEGYIFSLGKISENKGTDIALDVAKALGEKIIIAGTVHSFVPEIRTYWENRIKPKLDRIVEEVPSEKVGEFIREFIESEDTSIYVGELNDAQKKQWYQTAKAFYFPIREKEAFGLVIIESMACGTPVIAYNVGGVPEELIKHRETGFVVERGNLDGFCNAASQIHRISRKACRKHVKNHFTIERQARDYIEVYRDIISRIN